MTSPHPLWHQMHPLWHQTGCLLRLLLDGDSAGSSPAIWRLVMSIPVLGRYILKHPELVDDAMRRYSRKIEFTTGNGDTFVEWRLPNRVLHRGGDLPARIASNSIGIVQADYYRLGNLHRVDGPARVMNDGSDEEWYFEGVLHRNGGGPAVTYAALQNYNGTSTLQPYRQWYNHGKLHRSDGPAIITNDGGEMYYLNGKRHRDGDQPAVIEADGYRAWYVNGKRHRDPASNGELRPAVIRANGNHEFWLNDEHVDRTLHAARARSAPPHSMAPPPQRTAHAQAKKRARKQ